MEKHHIIKYRNEYIQILIKKNKLSRNYKLTFDKKYLRGLVSIPYYVTFKNGIEFANENIEWLYGELKKILPLILIKHNSSLLVKEKKMKIIFKRSKSHSVHLIENKIIVNTNKEDHNKILKKWINEQVLNLSKIYIDRISQKLGQSIKAVKLSDSFNYWGSCNTNGVIHLNWRLFFAPMNVLEYIIVHEICHLIEFNHTESFWRLVKKFCPDYKNQIIWLKKNDNYLYRIRFN